MTQGTARGGARRAPEEADQVALGAWERSALAYIDGFRDRVAREPPPPARIDALWDTVLCDQSHGKGQAFWAATTAEVMARHDPRDALSRSAEHVWRLTQTRRQLPALAGEWAGELAGDAGVELLRALHRRVQPASGQAAPGRFKATANEVYLYTAARERVGVIETARPAEVAGLLGAAFAALGRHLASPATHPLVCIAGLECRLLWIHPFEDGNGRTARMLSTLLALRAGYAFAPWVGVELSYTEDISYTRHVLLRMAAQCAYLSERLYGARDVPGVPAYTRAGPRGGAT